MLRSSVLPGVAALAACALLLLNCSSDAPLAGSSTVDNPRVMGFVYTSLGEPIVVAPVLEFKIRPRVKPGITRQVLRLPRVFPGLEKGRDFRVRFRSGLLPGGLCGQGRRVCDGCFRYRHGRGITEIRGKLFFFNFPANLNKPPKRSKQS